MLPTSYREDHCWYGDTKEKGCGLCDDCAYDMDSITESADKVKALIEHEMTENNVDGSKVFLGGFSQGGQLTNVV